MRVMVVGGRYVGAFFVINPQVVGDGLSSVADLIDVKLSKRRHKRLYPTSKIPLGDREKAFLADQGLTFESVPAAGRRVFLNLSLQIDQGADVVDMTETSSLLARQLAIRACEAVSVPTAGVDLLIDEETGRHVVLEVNQCPMIKANVFPFYTSSPGNRVAEAIIDHYFPGSLNNMRFTKASFNFARICDTLKSGCTSEVTLPILGRDCVHKRIRLAGTVVDNAAQDSIRSCAERHGVYIDILRTDGKDVLIDALGPANRYDAFVKGLEGRLTQTRKDAVQTR